MAYRLARFVVALPLGAGRYFVGDAIRGRRTLYDGAHGRLLRELGEPADLDELVDALADDELFALDPARLPVVLRELCEQGVVVEDTTPDEEVAAARAYVEGTFLGRPAETMRAKMRERFAPVRRTTGGIVEPRSTAHAKAVVLGWCTAEALAPAIADEARLRGVSMDVLTGFEDDVAVFDGTAPDLVLLQPGHARLLGDLLGIGGAVSASERIAQASSLVTGAVRAVRERMGDGVLVVQGLASPQSAPLGFADALDEPSFSDRIFEVNRALRRAVRASARSVYLDVDMSFGSAGKERMLDDLLVPYSHAGVLDSQTNHEAHSRLARRVLDAWEATRGESAIRCVAVDLDGVLWPGEVADPAFSFDDEERVSALVYGVHGGVHEALRALAARGIVLAAVSKNTPDGVLAKWKAASMRLGEGPRSHLLGPDDFAVLEIGWGEKSAALGRIASTLGMAPHAIAFIDDSPIERAEVAHALPDVMVLDVPHEELRATLLFSPCFDVPARTDEARHRSVTTRARVERDRASAAAPDRAAFLRDLRVRCVVRAVRSADDASLIERIWELASRTNQLRTTTERPSRDDVCRWLTAGNEILVMSVEDRFASYGVVGVAFVRAGEVGLFALSCRVIGDEVHDVLFRAALGAARTRSPCAPTRALFERTAHNLPALRLFEGRLFREIPGGYELPTDAPLPPLPPHCQVSGDGLVAS